MPRRRRIPKLRRAPLSDGLLDFFQTGDPTARRAKAAGLCDPAWALFVECGLVEHQRQRWDEHADEVMDLHLRQWPGTRPHAWWRWSAPEPRRVLSGAALLKPKVTPTSWEFWWRERFGVQAMVQIRPRDVQGVPALIESQASYLARLALLTNEERARLTPAAFEAEPYDPFRCSEEELERGKAAGGDAARRARQLERDLGNPRAIRA